MKFKLNESESNNLEILDNVLIKCTGRDKEIKIPNSVTSIGDFAFSGCEKLEKIEIPNSVTSIGDYAFLDCEKLEKIEIPNSVTSIGDFAFSGCEKLEKIEIPNSVTKIATGAFERCEKLTVFTENKYVIEYCKNNKIKYNDGVYFMNTQINDNFILKVKYHYRSINLSNLNEICAALIIAIILEDSTLINILKNAALKHISLTELKEKIATATKDNIKLDKLCNMINKII